ncbi:MAG: hypothetical protein ACREFJ_17640 [Acetobacteraceae bacterium]
MIDLNTLPEDIQRAVRLEAIHYTSAEAALSIIRSTRLWMRNLTCMSDYREVQRGFDIINKLLSDPARRKAFDDADPATGNFQPYAGGEHPSRLRRAAAMAGRP